MTINLANLALFRQAWAAQLEIAIGAMQFSLQLSQDDVNGLNKRDRNIRWDWDTSDSINTIIQSTQPKENCAASADLVLTELNVLVDNFRQT